MRHLRFASLAGMGVLATLLVPTASGDAATTQRLGGVYPLKPGIYVQQGTPCSSPPNVAIRQYDGRGISTAHTRACRAKVLSRHGRRYTVEQSCIDAGAGPASASSSGSE